MMIAILIAAIVAALVVFSFLCYKKAPPTQAIVVTGFGLSRPKVVCGRGVSTAAVFMRSFQEPLLYSVSRGCFVGIPKNFFIEPFESPSLLFYKHLPVDH